MDEYHMFTPNPTNKDSCAECGKVSGTDIHVTISEPHFKQVELSPEEADLMGTAMMNLIDSALALRDLLSVDEDGTVVLSEPDSKTVNFMENVINWAGIMLSNIHQQTAKAGLGMMP